ncbi:MAG: saccharopine dehydrogenase NADP-binding domain-containing protein [Bacteroidales bacterium]|nr:saccharopine dehydrogenase NADP-binding domain-containing protein [Bacteroidales bacterium]
MKDVLILGAGMVGRAIAYDLSKKYTVTSADVSEMALNKLSMYDNIKKLKIDVSDTLNLKKIIDKYDIVVSAVPGFLGYNTIKTIVECKKDFIDISFMPENALSLNEMALENNVTGIVDMGVAPGVPNLFAGFYYNKMKITNFEYMVGGLPKIRKWPFQYKAPFSPIDVIEEYTRPVRHVINGKQIILPPMSDVELVNIRNIGTLEAFNTDGLRSLLFTLPEILNMKEKTLRYPGHIYLVKALVESGFFSKEKIEGLDITPFDVTTKILFKNWKLEEDEEEFTIMLITIEGYMNNIHMSITCTLYDEYDKNSRLSSMARTTGFTATAGVELIMSGLFNKKGIFPPELIGQDDKCFNFIINYLKERNISIEVEEKEKC